MSQSNTNVGNFPFRVVQGVTSKITVRTSGFAEDFRDATWSAGVFDLATKETVFEATVTAPDATTLVLVFDASDLSGLDPVSGKYGYNAEGTIGDVVIMPIKGRLDVERRDT